ncbi:putative heparan-alpha-glucosaminide N-acetyltransferase [Helianthus annuus]|nr:putative heparan-alpha-glucosaminide N-acetyltransferase [Helianthus annuus]
MEGPKRLEEGFGHAQISMAGEKPKTTMVELTDDQIKTTTKENEQPNGGDNPLLTKKSKRVATLDAFRGLTIVLMILVDDAGGVYERMDHSPWNGCTLADFVLPFFLFIVGVAIALALKRVPNTKYAVKKIIIRTLKMLFWGIILQGGYSHAPYDLNYGVDMKKIRWCGILQVFLILPPSH